MTIVLETTALADWMLPVIDMFQRHASQTGEVLNLSLKTLEPATADDKRHLVITIDPTNGQKAKDR